jgi:hypothetical protein
MHAGHWQETRLTDREAELARTHITIHVTLSGAVNASCTSVERIAVFSCRVPSGVPWHPRSERPISMSFAQATRSFGCSRPSLSSHRDVRVFSKSTKYNEIMKEKMQWDPNSPYEYRFERGLYYHHILDNELLCGSQPTCADDVKYLSEAENVNTIVSVRKLERYAQSYPRAASDDCVCTISAHWGQLHVGSAVMLV